MGTLITWYTVRNSDRGKCSVCLVGEIVKSVSEMDRVIRYGETEEKEKYKYKILKEIL